MEGENALLALRSQLFISDFRFRFTAIFDLILALGSQLFLFLILALGSQLFSTDFNFGFTASGKIFNLIHSYFRSDFSFGFTAIYTPLQTKFMGAGI